MFFNDIPVILLIHSDTYFAADWSGDGKKVMYIVCIRLCSCI